MSRLLVSDQHHLSLWLTEIFGAVFCDRDIFLQGQITIATYCQARFYRKDLPDFQFQIGVIAIFFPQRPQQRATIVRNAPKLVTQGMGVFRIACIRRAGST